MFGSTSMRDEISKARYEIHEVREALAKQRRRNEELAVQLADTHALLFKLLAHLGLEAQEYPAQSKTVTLVHVIK